jgi:hypothetical protein
MKLIHFAASILLSITLCSQAPNDTIISDFHRPQRTLAWAPLALADMPGGPGLRVSSEYRLNAIWNGMTEATVYMPYHNFYRSTSGVRIRQDFRKYAPGNNYFYGFSLMFKYQTIDHIAVVPINDSTRYRKNYSLVKNIICPAFVIGSHTYMGETEGWYIETSAYLGLRFKDAHKEGLTGGEAGSMWPYDLEATDFALRMALQDGIRVHPEITGTIKIGYDFGSKNKRS